MGREVDGLKNPRSLDALYSNLPKVTAFLLSALQKKLDPIWRSIVRNSSCSTAVLYWVLWV